MTNIKPMAGDVVICLGGNEIGQKAVIEGIVGEARETFMVTYNFSAFRDDKHVSASGGCAYWVDASALVDSGETINVKFWRWRDGIAGAGQGQDYYLDVRLWLYTKPEPHPVYPNVSPKELKARNSIEFDSRFALCDLAKGEQVKLYRGDYPVSYHAYPPEFGFGCEPDDSMGRTLVSLYKRFETIQLFSHDEPVGCGYLFTLTSVLDRFAFRDEQALDNFLEAYALEVKERKHGWGRLVIPNVDFEKWKPLRWVKTSG